MCIYMAIEARYAAVTVPYPLTYTFIFALLVISTYYQPKSCLGTQIFKAFLSDDMPEPVSSGNTSLREGHIGLTTCSLRRSNSSKILQY
jgi:hypothetical protein